MCAKVIIQFRNPDARADATVMSPAETPLVERGILLLFVAEALPACQLILLPLLLPRFCTQLIFSMTL